MFTRREILGEIRESTSKRRIYRKPQYKKFLERKPRWQVISQRGWPECAPSRPSRIFRVAVLHDRVPDKSKQRVANSAVINGENERVARAA